MDELEEFIVKRLTQRFHPYILPDGGGWRWYPPHIAKLLEVLEPIHVIAVTGTFVAVDGVYVEDPRSMHEKYELALEAAERIFGNVTRKVGIAANTEVGIDASGSVAFIFYFQGGVWYLVPSVKKTPYPARFAYIADSRQPFAWRDYWREADRVTCVAYLNENSKTVISASLEFFADPRPENAERFGDLCFLAQMSDGWVVSREIDVEMDRYESLPLYADPYEYVANVLRRCVGLKSFVSHGCEELLLRGNNDPAALRWRRLLRMLEDGLHSQVSETDF